MLDIINVGIETRASISVPDAGTEAIVQVGNFTEPPPLA